MTGAVVDAVDDLVETRPGLVYAAVVGNTVLLALLLYAVVGGRTPTRYWLIPPVWFVVGSWALVRTSPAPSSRRSRLAAGTVAGLYFLVLGVAGGLFGPAGGPTTGLTVQIVELPPGWNPALLYGGASVRLALVPFTTFGYLVLAYLVYATALEAKGAVAGGLLGVFSCVSCTLPVVASLVGGFVGGGAALAAAASGQTYVLGTLVFVVTVLLLTYRPGMERLGQFQTRIGRS